MIEVEQKYRVANLKDFVLRLQQIGFEQKKTCPQSDSYFQHPCRDFSQTDEALRLRIESQQWFVSYKGPKKKGPLKQRFELELPISSTTDTQMQWSELLTSLGFSFVARVEKTRQYWHCTQSPEITIAIDELKIEGESSQYCEIEMLCDEDATDLATRSIETMARSLELTEVIRSSYLEMVLDARS